MHTSPAERFEAKVDRSGNCHRWTGAHTPAGYGRFRYEDRNRLAHSVALLLAGVDIPDGMTVDHVAARGCRFKDCVRVDHLEVVSLAVNIARSDGPPARNARKVECDKGHPFTPENTLVRSHGGRPPERECLTCSRDRMDSRNTARRQARKLVAA